MKSVCFLEEEVLKFHRASICFLLLQITDNTIQAILIQVLKVFINSLVGIVVDQELMKLIMSDRFIPQHNVQKLSSQICIHGFLLWFSLAFLMPVGILVIRMSGLVRCRQKLKVIFYSHVFLQVSSVFLATLGAIQALRKFENTFNNTHQRIGLGLYAIVCLQLLVGTFCRPNRGEKGRSMWYFIHWFGGTVASIIAMADSYIGLVAYHSRTSRSNKIWLILLTFQFSIMAFIYLLQDRWDYIKKQSTEGPEQIIDATHGRQQVLSPFPTHITIKELLSSTTTTR